MGDIHYISRIYINELQGNLMIEEKKELRLMIMKMMKMMMDNLL